MAKATDNKDTKEKIFLAAAKLFAVKGFHATSMRDLAKEADVNLALINYHFSNKENLFNQVLKRGLDLFKEVMEDHQGQDLENLLKFLMKEALNKRGYGYYLNIYMRLFIDQSSDVEIIKEIFEKGPPGFHVLAEAVKKEIGPKAKEMDVVIISQLILGQFVHLSRIKFGMGNKKLKNSFIGEYLGLEDTFTELLLQLAKRLTNEAKR